MRYTQPQSGPLSVDRANPITRGMLCGVIPHMRRDFVTGAAYTQDGAYATSVSSAGVGLTTNGSSSDIWVAIPQVVLTKFTLFGVFRSSGNAVDTRALALGSSLSTNPIVQLGAGANTASKVRVYSRDDGTGGPSSAVDSTVSAFDGTLHSVAITYDGANVNCYIDGKFDSSAAAASLVFTVDRFCVGALYRSSAASWWAGTTFIGGAWNRALAASEISSLHANPWQTVKSPQRVMIATTGASYNVAMLESLVLTESSSTILQVLAATTDSLVPVNTSDIVAAMNGIMAESLVITDTLISSGNLNTSTVDSIVVSDLCTSIMNASCVFVDSLVVSDTSAGSNVTSASSTEILVLTNVQDWASASNVANADTLVVSDSGSASLIITPVQTETIVLSDGSNIVASFFAASAENVTLTEASISQMSVLLNAQDSIVLVDVQSPFWQTTAALFDNLIAIEVTAINTSFIILPKHYPLAGQKQTYPLEGRSQQYPLGN